MTDLAIYDPKRTVQLWTINEDRGGAIGSRRYRARQTLITPEGIVQQGEVVETDNIPALRKQFERAGMVRVQDSDPDLMTAAQAVVDAMQSFRTTAPADFRPVEAAIIALAVTLKTQDAAQVVEVWVS